jgi:hypothetical protein
MNHTNYRKYIKYKAKFLDLKNKKLGGENNTIKTEFIQNYKNNILYLFTQYYEVFNSFSQTHYYKYFTFDETNKTNTNTNTNEMNTNNIKVLNDTLKGINSDLSTQFKQYTLDNFNDYIRTTYTIQLTDNIFINLIQLVVKIFTEKDKLYVNMGNIVNNEKLEENNVDIFSKIHIIRTLIIILDTLIITINKSHIKLNNIKITLPSKLDIYVKVKPVGATTIIENINNTLKINNIKQNTDLTLNPNPNLNLYLHTNKIFLQTDNTPITNKTIALEMTNLQNNLINGIPCIIFPYGGSGSGKTSVLFYFSGNSETKIPAEYGVIPKLLSLTNITDKYNKLSLEIYELFPDFNNFTNDNIQINRTTHNDNSNSNSNILTFEFKDEIWVTSQEYIIPNHKTWESLYIPFDNSEYFENTEEQLKINQGTILPIILEQLITKKRAICRTLQNIESSRSHIFCKFNLSHSTNTDNINTLVVADLAGKEFVLDFNDVNVYRSLLQKNEPEHNQHTVWTFEKIMKNVNFVKTQLPNNKNIPEIITNMYGSDNGFHNYLNIIAAKLNIINENSDTTKLFNTLLDKLIEYSKSQDGETNQFGEKNLQEFYGTLNNNKNISDVIQKYIPVSTTNSNKFSMENKQYITQFDNIFNELNLRKSGSIIVTELYAFFTGDTNLSMQDRIPHYYKIFGITEHTKVDDKKEFKTQITDLIKPWITEIQTKILQNITEREQINITDNIETLFNNVRESQKKIIKTETVTKLTDSMKILMGQIKKYNTAYKTQLTEFNNDHQTNVVDKNKLTKNHIFSCFALSIVIIFVIAFQGKYINSSLDNISSLLMVYGQNHPNVQECSYDYYLANSANTSKNTDIKTLYKNIFGNIISLDEQIINKYKLTLLFTMKKIQGPNEPKFYLPYIKNNNEYMTPYLLKLLLINYNVIVKEQNEKNELYKYCINILNCYNILNKFNIDTFNFKSIHNNDFRIYLTPLIIKANKTYFTTLLTDITNEKIDKNIIIILRQKISTYLTLIDNPSADWADSVITHFDGIIDYINQYNAPTLIGTTTILEILNSNKFISCVKPNLPITSPFFNNETSQLIQTPFTEHYPKTVLPITNELLIELGVPETHFNKSVK